MPARKALPSSDHVMRFASRSRRIHDPETDTYLGPSPAAFEIREEDSGGLSVTWIEHFGDNGTQSRAKAAAAYRETLRVKRLPPSAIFAWANVEKIVSAGKEYRKSLRIVHDPVEGNSGHAEIRHFSDDDLDLLDYISSEVFTEYVVVSEMGIPPM